MNDHSTGAEGHSKKDFSTAFEVHHEIHLQEKMKLTCWSLSNQLT